MEKEETGRLKMTEKQREERWSHWRQTAPRNSTSLPFTNVPDGVRPRSSPANLGTRVFKHFWQEAVGDLSSWKCSAGTASSLSISIRSGGAACRHILQPRWVRNASLSAPVCSSLCTVVWTANSAAISSSIDSSQSNLRCCRFVGTKNKHTDWMSPGISS